MDNELPKIKIDERTCIEYHLEGDYYIPNLVMPKQEKITLNKYGNYLKEYKKADYTSAKLLYSTLRSISLNFVSSGIHRRFTVPIGPLRCLAMITSATLCSASERSLL